jgi:uncharacterized protein YjdB
MVILASWSCGSTQPSDSTPQVAAIVVNPASSTLALNAQLPLQALVQNEAGELVPDASVTWTVENPTVASVSPTGVVTGLALGTTQVAANARGKSGLATVTVQRTPVASVVVVPNRVSAGIGVTTKLDAKAYDAGQTELADRGMVWTTSNASVATVDGTGLVTTKGKGTATITATAEGKSGTSEFTVSPGAVSKVSITPSSLSMVTGDRQQLTARAEDANGTQLTGSTVVWASDRTTVATINGGQVTAMNAGSATITATVDGIVGSAAITVGSAPAASVTVTPGTLALTVTQTGTLAATVRDANGNVLAGRAVSWATNNALVATVSQAGVVTGLLPGTATITATSGNASGTATVTVSPIPVGTVSVSPSSRSIVQNTSTTLTATVKDANGNTLNGQSITWTTSDANIASLSAASGQSIDVTGGVSGTATITATSGGKSGTSTITVTNGTVATVTVTLQNTTIKKNTSTTVSATALDGSGRPLQGRTVAWSVPGSDPATVSPSSSVTTGPNSVATTTATAKSVSNTDTARITATVGGKSGSATLTVTP